MDKRLFEHDPLTGTTSWFHYDEENDDFIIHTQQETQDIVDQNIRDSNDASTGWQGDWHRVASIPLTVFVDLQKKGIMDDPVALKKWLNDPDNAYFRTKHGMV